MADAIEELRRWHVPRLVPPVTLCAHDGDNWPCGAAIVLAALDAANGHLGDMIAGKRIAEAALDAALARERRLREAAQAAVDMWEDPNVVWPDDRLGSLRAALAEPEAGS